MSKTIGSSAVNAGDFSNLPPPASGRNLAERGDPALRQVASFESDAASPDITTSSSSPDVKSGEQTEQQLEDLTEQVNRIMSVMDKELRFKIDRDSAVISVEVVNAQTGKVVRTIPPESLLKFKEKFETMLGLLFDSTA